jgi:ribosome biogenesis GTPase
MTVVQLERELLSGLIISSQSGFFKVQTEAGVLVCKLRGRLKRGNKTGDLAAIGDRVKVRPLNEGEGIIEQVEPRLQKISRLAPTPRGVYEQVIIANPDQILFVFACADPEPRFRMLDRFLVSAEKQKVPAIIVANKIDLVGIRRAREMFSRYRAIDYPVIFTSAKEKIGIIRLKSCLRGKISALTGPSGTGKSSLLNAIQPGLGLEIKRTSTATGKGRHATVSSAMFPLEGGGYVADTPGMKAMALWDIEPEELDGYFREIRPLVAMCQFSDCTHLHEPGCAVLAAVEKKRIDSERYESYRRLRLGEN